VIGVGLAGCGGEPATTSAGSPPQSGSAAARPASHAFARCGTYTNGEGTYSVNVSGDTSCATARKVANEYTEDQDDAPRWSCSAGTAAGLGCVSGNARIEITLDTSGHDSGEGASPRSWTEVALPNAASSAQALSAISCASASDCVVVGTDAGNNGAAWVTTDAGLAWHERVLGSGATGPESVSCSSPSDCVAVGGGDPGPGEDWVTTNGGTSWVEHAVPSADTTQPTVGGFNDVSCVSTQICVASGADSNGNGTTWTTRDGGASWTPTSVPDTSNSTASNGGGLTIACSGQAFCLTVGTNNSGDGVAWTQSGGQWSEQTIPEAEANGEVQDVSCGSASDCVAAGADASGHAAVWTTSDGGVDWTEQIVPNSDGGNGYVRWVSCPSTEVCVAVGNDTNGEDAWTTSDAGATWTEQPIPNITAADGTLADISCGSAIQCVAIGDASDGAAAAWVGPA
jgi:hypothetical protein